MIDIKRKIYPVLQGALRRSPIVGLLGPRQSGKTTLAKEIGKHYNKSVYLDMEMPSDLRKLADPELFLDPLSNHLVILDEVQRVPELFPLLRALVDKDRRPSRFLLLGSADKKFIQQSSESLAGRIEYLELSPFLLSEIGFDNFEKHWLRGGFPLSYSASSQLNSALWRKSFLLTYIERDLVQMGLTAESKLIYRLLQMIAHQNGGIWNASTIAASLGLSQPTIQKYLDYLEGAFIIYKLTPLLINTKKRLVKAPKIYFRDSGILHTLWERVNREELLSHPEVGSSFEGWALSQLHSELRNMYDFSFYRTHAGTECDLILSKGGIPVYGIEIKLSMSPEITPSIRNTLEDLNLKEIRIIIPTKEKGYSLGKNVRVSNLNEVLKDLGKKP